MTTTASLPAVDPGYCRLDRGPGPGASYQAEHEVAAGSAVVVSHQHRLVYGARESAITRPVGQAPSAWMNAYWVIIFPMPTWIESNFWAAIGGAGLGALLTGALVLGTRWADLPRPHWVLVGGGAGGGPPGEGGSGRFTLVNAGNGQAVDVWVMGVHCDAQFVLEDDPEHGLGNRVPTCAPGERLTVSLPSTSPTRHLVAVELSWSQASVRKRSRRTRLWVQIWGPPWEERPQRVDPSPRGVRRLARRARYRMGRASPEHPTR